jgi:NADP-dependent 3-hydroxy acid dehydrogenase YdfG
LLYDNGARIVTCARGQERLDDLRRELGGGDGRLFALSADVGAPEDINAIGAAVEDHLGGLDILISNAAVAVESVFNSKSREIAKILQVNLFGQIAYIERCLPLLRKGGRIVMIGSMSADVREEEGTVYVASKAGLQGFAGAFRKEANKHGVHVHLIEPGAVATPLHGLSEEDLADKREKSEMLAAEDTAGCVEFVLTRPETCDVVSLQVRPHRQFI